MPRSRVVRFFLVAAALVAGVSVHAQFSNPLGRVPRPPTVPGAGQPAAPTPERRPYGAGITDDMVTRYIKAMTVQKEVLAKELAAAKAAKARADALAQRRTEGMLNELTKTSECTDAFKEKDPRSQEIARLDRLAEAATNQGDDAKAEEYQKRSSDLGMVLDVAADRACGGKGASALYDCMEKKKLTLAAQGVAEPMLTVQAQGECMQDPATSGTPGMTGPSAEEEAANRQASEAMQNARANADRAGAQAANFTGEQFAMIDHCIRNRLGGGPGCAEDSNIVIDRYREELRQATGQ